MSAPPREEKQSDASARPKRPLTVSELSQKIARLLEGEIGRVCVEGEVSNYRVPRSGHAYFVLKDADAAINVVCFRSTLASLKIKLADGKKIEIGGRVSAYTARSEYQIIMESAREAGLGDLMRLFLELRDKLKAEGLFDPARKKPLPRFPRAIGIVTSGTGAALRDMLNVLSRRAGGLEIYLSPCAVQGDTAPAEIVRAIERLERHGRSEVIIAGRGGGSLENLWAFNDERVVRAIARCEIPIVSAVGHETDTTLSDFAADLRAPTPSAAAEIVTANHEELARNLARTHRSMDRAMEDQLDSKRVALQACAASWGMRSPLERLAATLQKIDDLTGRLEGAAERNRNRARTLLENLQLRLSTARPDLRWLPRLKYAAGLLSQFHVRLKQAMARRLNEEKLGVKGLRDRLESLGPPAVLRRGFSFITTLKDKRIVTGPDQVRVGQTLNVHSDGGKWRVAALPNMSELFDIEE